MRFTIFDRGQKKVKNYRS